MSKNILVIDDEPDILKTIKYALEQENYAVWVASDGEEGLRKVRQDSPDLVILDLNLPKMAGEEVCREIRKDAKTANLPVIMLTAKGLDADRIIGRVIGADCYMTKPFDPDDLSDRIKELLEGKKE